VWIDELNDEFRHQQEEISKKDSLRVLRKTVFESEGPTFFAALESEVRNGVDSLAQRNTELKDLILDPSNGRRFFRVRNPELRPSVTVSVHLEWAHIIVRIGMRPSAQDPETENGSHRIDFTLDRNDRLALCMKCEPLNIDDVAKIILRPALGFTGSCA